MRRVGYIKNLPCYKHKNWFVKLCLRPEGLLYAIFKPGYGVWIEDDPRSFTGFYVSSLKDAEKYIDDQGWY